MRRSWPVAWAVSTVSTMSFEGTERRRHRLIVTRNTEYHLRDDLCVAVRDRSTKRWAEGHLAVNRKVEGGVRFFDNGAVVPSLSPPRAGDAIFFFWYIPSSPQYFPYLMVCECTAPLPPPWPAISLRTRLAQFKTLLITTPDVCF